MVRLGFEDLKLFLVQFACVLLFEQEVIPSNLSLQSGVLVVAVFLDHLFDALLGDLHLDRGEQTDAVVW